MKKLLYTCLLIFGFNFIGQTAVQAQGNIGIRGGVNFATVTGDNVEADSRTGLMVGLYKILTLANSPISIQPEILYSQKGFKSTETVSTAGVRSKAIETSGSASEEVDITFKFDYIEVPVLARFDFGGSGSVAPHIYAGPYIGFKINATAEADGFDEDQDVDNVSSTDFGGVIGAGVDIGAINIGARYSVGFSNINDEGDGDTKNSVFSVVAGFAI